MVSYRESFIVYIACDPPALFWTGHGPLPLSADSVIPFDMVAPGAGELIEIPDFQQLLNGTSERLDFIVSGVSDETLRLALADAPSVRNARVDLGRITFDANWQQVGGIEWEATFEARSLNVSRPRADGAMAVRTISLTIAHGDTVRARAPNAYFTDADQSRKYPTDAAFNRVAGINAGSTRRFGPRT